MYKTYNFDKKIISTNQFRVSKKTSEYSIGLIMLFSYGLFTFNLCSHWTYNSDNNHICSFLVF